MKPLMSSYSVNKPAKNYNVVVVGNFANALLLGDYTGEPTKNTYPIDGI